MSYSYGAPMRGEGDNTLNLRNSLLWRKMNNIADKKYIGVPIIDKTIDYGITKGMKKLKNHFGVELKIPVSNIKSTSVEKLYEWLASHSNKIRKVLDVQKMDADIEHPMLIDMSAYIKLNRQTYMMVLIGQAYRDAIATSSNMLSLSLSSNLTINDSDMYIYIFGKSSIRYKKAIEKIIRGKSINTLRTYKVSGDPNPKSDVAFKSIYQDLDRRELSTIFMENGTIDKICSHIDKYIANKDVYSGRGIIYKTGILLYGEPGTGKTSLIKALACKYNYDLILLDMVSFSQIDIETLTHSIDIDDKKYIIALEDIDCVIADRENVNIDKDEKKIVNKLLQFLDSNSSPNDIIFIASTNHIELLDEALLREGRFDLRCKIGGIRKDKAIEMCKSFNLSDTQISKVIQEAEDIVGSLDDNTIRQSKLQNIILKYSGLNLKGEVEDEEDIKASTNDGISDKETDGNIA